MSSENTLMLNGSLKKTCIIRTGDKKTTCKYRNCEKGENGDEGVTIQK